MSSSSGDEYTGYRKSFPLHDAIEAGSMDLVSRIIHNSNSNHGCGMDVDDADGNSGKENDHDDHDMDGGGGQGARGGIPFHMAHVPYHPPVDLEERDPEGATPLHVAMSYKRLEAARMLLEAGAGTSKRLEGSTPAHIALAVSSVRKHRDFADAALKLLLEHSLDIAAKDDRGQTLLHVAAGLGLDDSIHTILAAPGGRELLDSKERLFCRPLHLAALGGHMEATKALIAAGCDSSVTSLHGNTALHLACSKARWDVARVLLDEGKANPSVRNKSKQTPAELALKQGLRIPHTLPEMSPQRRPPTDVMEGNGVAPSPGAVAATIPAAEATVATTVMDDGTRGDGLAAVTALPSSNQSELSSSKRVQSSSSPIDAAAQTCGDGSDDDEGSDAGRVKTVIFHHRLCLEHFTMPPIRRSGGDPPPENVKRLEVIYNEDSGVLRADEFSCLDWESNPGPAQLGDILRVHDYTYVQKLERLCSSIPNRPSELRHLDGDTAVSRNSFEAALRAAGSVCDGIERVIAGKNRNAFCAVRPPGHHAGPRGLVTCANDMAGSHGFCLLNNVAIGAAYARCVHRHAGVDRVAIVDFDVHHGNGTEDIVKALVPRIEESKIHTPFCSGILQQVHYKPWLNGEDAEKCLFVSVHGYGKKERRYQNMQGGWFYPGSGETTDCPLPSEEQSEGQSTTAAGEGRTGAQGGAEGGRAENGDVMREGQGGEDEVLEDRGAGEEREGSGTSNGSGDHGSSSGAGTREATSMQPLVLDVGMPLPEPDDTPGASRHRWRDVYRKEILPKLAAFNPDLILVSAGFDAHKKDSINFGYIGLLEEDYEWVTQQLVQVANKCCQGRLVSVLEGGYRIQGGIVSAFGRSVAGHVRALVDGCQSRQEWSAEDAAWESNFEQRLLQERERKRKLRLEQQLQAMRDREQQLRVNMLLQQQQHQADEQMGNNDATETAAEHTAPAPAPAPAAAPAAAPTAAPAAALAAGDDDGVGSGVPAAETEEDDASSRKRRRGNVDYVALQRKLQEEEIARRAAALEALVAPPPPATGGNESRVQCLAESDAVADNADAAPSAAAVSPADG